jgi:phospholipid/cholesterol/gamma-HCH transport system substrate-binding protein
MTSGTGLDSTLSRNIARPLAGLVAVLVLIAILVGAVVLFRGGITKTVPLTVLSGRAGLVMEPDAKVKLLGVPVGRVVSIEERADGQAEIHLDMNPAILQQIPENVKVEIASPTVFGAKSIDLTPPDNASTVNVRPGQVLDASNVTVEFNTTFEHLSALLSKIRPEKLNETLGAIASALDGRGDKFGQALVDFDSMLANLEPSLPNLRHDIETAPVALGAYADAAPDLVRVLDKGSQISQTLVDEQDNLDALLLSATGLADVGNDVIGSNTDGLAKVLHLLAPTTDLTSEYSKGLYCALAGMVRVAESPPLPKPGLAISVSLTLGAERYRYPADLPKVAASGGPQCGYLPNVPPETRPKFVVADVGANPWQYGNQGILLNSDGLKQMLFGPLDGPARNSAQIGQPG